MKKLPRFFKALLNEIIKDDLFSISNALTYNLLLALFPLAIFLMSTLGFFKIDGTRILLEFYSVLPTQIFNLMSIFVTEVLQERRLSLLSTSLLVTLYSASSGFNAIIRGINKSYGNEETRSTLRVRLIAVGLVVLFTFSAAVCFTAIVFSDYIMTFIKEQYNVSGFGLRILVWIQNFGSLFLLLLACGAIYKVSSCKTVRFLSVLPGAAVTVVFWVLASKIFNIYINNFSKYSVIYGSLGGVYVLVLWLNIIAFVLLLGSEINALLEKRY